MFRRLQKAVNDVQSAAAVEVTVSAAAASTARSSQVASQLCYISIGDNDEAEHVWPGDKGSAIF